MWGPDPAGEGDNGRALGGTLQKRYAHTGGVWEKTKLTYRIVNNAGYYTGKSTITQQQSDDEIRRAFKVWRDVTPLEFEETTDKADIVLSFGPGYHGDPYPFDGPSGTLAHAYPPMSNFGELDGDVHFDDDEQFIYGEGDFPKINLFITAAHELGHAFGLAHSTVPGALMAPFYQPYKNGWTLPYDDQYGIQLLYGSRLDDGGDGGGDGDGDGGAGDGSGDGGAGGAGDDGGKTPSACNSLTFNAIGYIRGELFAFREDRYWRVRTPGMLLTPQEGDESQYFWYQLPKDINAAYERYHDGRFLFFKGDQYYEYDGLSVVNGFPKSIKELDADLPSDIDAVLTYDEYLKTYFFKGDQVWRYDEPTQSVDEGWPYDIDLIFPGVPSNLDAAFRYKDGMTTFVKGTQYYIYNDFTGSLESGYPKSFVEDFLGCEPDNLVGENAASSKTPTLLGVVLGTSMVVLNMLI